jgi:D-alanyl-lipoteichoic acid acyltransferase DltB (MBOAT superfamily)
MILGFVSGILGLTWLILGKIAGWVTWLFLTYEILVVKWLSRISFASVEIKNVWMGLLVIYYLILFGWLWWVRRPRHKVGSSIF